jgi:plastocyanin
MRGALVGACALAAAVAAGAPAATGEGQVREVAMPGKVFAPGRAQALVGDTVVWRNGDSTNHTVTADDASFDSGYIAPGGTFSRTFTKVGLYAYHCTIHKFMRGEVVVVPVALAGPGQPVIAGGRVVLQGLAPTGTRTVVVRRAGKPARVERRVAPAGDGSFTVTLRADRPVDFTAVAKGRSSPRVHVAVAPKVAARRNGKQVAARAAPKRPGARAVLQAYVRERFAWRTIARSRLDGRSRVTFTLPGGQGRYRVVVRGGDGWADGASAPVVTR